MSTIKAEDAKVILKKLGWRVGTSGTYTASLKNFQRAWSLGPRLEKDGVLGPLTSKALLLSDERRVAGLTTCSKHFSFREFVCHCGGAFSSCARIWVTHELVAALEALRYSKFPKGLTIVSACRCTGWNKAVDGAVDSRHVHGDAADIPGIVPISAVRSLHLFTGLGYNASNNKVRHVDLRPGNKSRPTTWEY